MGWDQLDVLRAGGGSEFQLGRGAVHQLGAVAGVQLHHDGVVQVVGLAGHLREPGQVEHVGYGGCDGVARLQVIHAQLLGGARGR